MKTRVFILMAIIAAVAIFFAWPTEIVRTKQYGGPCYVAVWKVSDGRFSVSAASNKYYTGLGCNLPGVFPTQFACDYAIACSSKSIYWQYPKANRPAMITLIKFPKG